MEEMVKRQHCFRQRCILRGIRITLINSKICKTARRRLDILLSIFFIFLFLPLMSIISILIRLDSTGPVIFKHKRIGQNEKEFTMFKFRTMYADTRCYDYKPRINDSRITKVGRFLRATGLDELPQLLNVVRGDMSLVGPRPEMPFIVKNYSLLQKERLKVNPGITGFWQISGKTQMPIVENLNSDLYYTHNQSLFLDLKIIIWTGILFLGNAKDALFRYKNRNVSS